MIAGNSLLKNVHLSKKIGYWSILYSITCCNCVILQRNLIK